MNGTYRNAIAVAGGVLVTHIGLVNQAGVEIAGGAPAYARQAVGWGAPVNGLVRPNGNLTFDIPTGVTVGGWRGYSASSGGTDYGGADLTQEAFAGQGQYVLVASGTGIDHRAA